MAKKSNTEIFPLTNAPLPLNKVRREQAYALLSSWMNVHAEIKHLNGFPAAYTRQLIVLEKETRNRPHMLKRLVAHLLSTERATLYKKLGL